MVAAGSGRTAARSLGWVACRSRHAGGASVTGSRAARAEEPIQVRAAADLAQLMQTSRMEVMPTTLDLGVRPRGNAGPVERVAAETDRHLAQRRERVAPERGELRREVINRQGSLEPCIVAHGEEYLEGLPNVMEDGAP